MAQRHKTRRARLVAGVLALGAVPALLAGPVALAQPAPAERVIAFSPDQVRQMGLQAMQLGRPDIAARMATALLEQDPTDSYAHFLMANGLMKLNRIKEAEAAAKQSYRYAETPEQTYQSAHLAADLAFRRGALTTSQWWLRKSAEAAPDEARKNTSVAQFRAVKAHNPWRVALAFSARPSDNVNNGSSGQYNIIDGLPLVGILSQDAQAVKGVVVDTAVALGYRISQGKSHETTLGLEVFTRRVHLGTAEKTRLGGDPGFGSGRVAVSLQQDWRPENSKHQFSLGGNAGRQTYKGGGDYSFLGLHFGHRMPLASDMLVNSGLNIEQRSGQGGKRGDRSVSLRSTLLYQLGNQDLVAASALTGRFDTANMGRSSTMVGVQLDYTLAESIGPVSLSATLGVQKSQYNGYSLIGIAVPGGRNDTSGFAEMQLQFNDTSYAGFAPVLRLRHQRTQSNVSRFEAQESSVVIGLASKF
ncbi:surface lipoprotein assembly modifier [Pseudorhodobacter sp.]|uniref:surface lipoprotein assembly modifier n=1 Tax=Pseudorhodobacter sp. TaxID=1934400 RepID=UPI0039E5B68F